MKVKIAVLWWLVNDREHGSLKKKDMTNEALMPLVSALFPGIRHYYFVDFARIMRDYVTPILKKRYPELLNTPASEVKPKAMTKVIKVLPSKGYEWKDSAKWQSKFQKLLAA